MSKSNKVLILLTVIVVYFHFPAVAWDKTIRQEIQETMDDERYKLGFTILDHSLPLDGSDLCIEIEASDPDYPEWGSVIAPQDPADRCHSPFANPTFPPPDDVWNWAADRSAETTAAIASEILEIRPGANCVWVETWVWNGSEPLPPDCTKCVGVGMFLCE